MVEVWATAALTEAGSEALLEDPQKLQAALDALGRSPRRERGHRRGPQHSRTWTHGPEALQVGHQGPAPSQDAPDAEEQPPEAGTPGPRHSRRRLRGSPEPSDCKAPDVRRRGSGDRDD